MSSEAPLRFYCDESGTTGTNWLDPSQPTLVHGGWLFPHGAEDAIAAAVDDLRARYRLRAPELKWSQFTRRGREGAFREVFELCLTHGAMPMFIVMDKTYAVAAKVIETFFDPVYNQSLSLGFTADFDTKKSLAEIILTRPELASALGPWLQLGAAPSRAEVRRLARDVAACLEDAGRSEFARTLHSFGDSEIDDLRDEFAVDAMLRSTTWTVLWALTVRVLGFTNRLGVEVEFFQDQVVRFGPLIEQIAAQDGVARVKLVDSKEFLGVQLADLLCGFTRELFAHLTFARDLDSSQVATCADLFIMKQEFEAWNGNLPESTWMQFIDVAVPEVRRKYGTG